MKLPNGYGSVYKLKGKRRRPYTAVITIGKTKEGKIIRKTLGYYATKEEGLDALSLYRKSPAEAENQQITLKEVLDLFLEYRNAHDKPLADNYMGGMKQLAPIYNMPIAEVKTRHLQNIVDMYKKQPSTCKVLKSSMNMLFKYAIMEDYAQTNYATYVITPTIPKSTIHKPFTEAEIASLWEHTDRYDVRLALILIYTGMRPGELCRLDKKNIHLKERYLIGGIKTQAGIDRTIPIAKKIVPLFKLDDKLPGYPDAIGRLWKKSPVKALNNHLPHDGRHTCETLLNNADINKRIIQLIIGHAGDDIDEKVYTHKTTEQLIEAIDKI